MSNAPLCSDCGRLAPVQCVCPRGPRYYPGEGCSDCGLPALEPCVCGQPKTEPDPEPFGYDE